MAKFAGARILPNGASSCTLSCPAARMINRGEKRASETHQLSNMARTVLMLALSGLMFVALPGAWAEKGDTYIATMTSAGLPPNSGYTPPKVPSCVGGILHKTHVSEQLQHLRA